MKKTFSLYIYSLILFISIIVITGSSGCANMIPPTGGPRDSLPPVLLNSAPKDSSTNFTGNRVVLSFDEFVTVDNPQENVLVSPTQNNTPNVDYKLRTVTVKLRDTLEPATTYSINFGNAIKDVNEGNVLKNFTYVFSTGNVIDQNTFSGRVILAETGNIDTTLIVVLHRNLADSAVAKERPRYITKLDGKGNFEFRNLPTGTFAVYALPNDYSKRYDDTTKLFAFADNPVKVSGQTPSDTLYAYALPKPAPRTPAATAAPVGRGRQDARLRYTTNLDGNTQDVLKNLQINFNRKVTYDSTKILLTDKAFKPVTNYQLIGDTNRTTFTIRYAWPAGTDFNLLFDKGAFTDTAGVTLAKSDTIKFVTKKEEEYGSVRVRFKNLDLSKNPVLQLVQNETIVESIPLAQPEWSRKLFPPGEYNLRILYDANKNGIWDAGKFFGVHRQPERVISLKTNLNIRANWDNEKDITL
jgi:hypothetical protein